MVRFPALDEKWSYQSFCPARGNAESPPQIAVRLQKVSDPFPLCVATSFAEPRF